MRPVTPASILAAELDDLADEIGRLDAVAPPLRDRLRRARDLACGLDPYVEACTTPESPALAALARRTATEDWSAHRGSAPGPLEAEMLSGHVEGRLLAFLVGMLRATTVLEIGMFTGYSALALAEALPPGGTVVACELDEHAAGIARQAFAGSPAGDRIEVRVGPAGDTLARLAESGARFDLVFIDADKGGYAAYLEAVLGTCLLGDGGVVCVDNTLMQGQPWVGGATANGRAIADFNARVARDERVEQVLVPLRDGITLIRRVTPG